MKIGIYNPYLDSFGGGERYILTLASHWSEIYDVDIFWDDQETLILSGKRLGIDCAKIKNVPNIFSGTNLLSKLYETSKYDLIFFLTDGSIPTTFARHNILHFQVPFNPIKSFEFKRRRFDRIICNSVFTQSRLDPKFQINSEVIYPPVSVDDFKSEIKQKIILSVGRFSSQYQAKKQDIMIAAFKKGYDQGLFRDYKLVLVGGLLPGDWDYFNKLKQSCDKYPIEMYPNCQFDILKHLYAIAEIYWHAAGYGETDPAKMEHFGISTVEAMASGCIPVVFSGGGLPEIVTDGENGFLWQTNDLLISLTGKIIRKKRNNIQIAANAVKKSRTFNQLNFYESYDQLLKRISV